MKAPVGNPNLERSAGLEFEKPQVWRKTRQALRYKNRRSWRIEVFWFLELEEELGLIRQNHLTFMLGSFRKNAVGYSTHHVFNRLNNIPRHNTSDNVARMGVGVTRGGP